MEFSILKHVEMYSYNLKKRLSVTLEQKLLSLIHKVL